MPLSDHKKLIAGLMTGLLCLLLLWILKGHDMIHDNSIQTMTGTTSRPEQKKVAITFDDGPNPNYTEPLLAGLKERGVRASFFLLGKEAELYPDIVRDIHNDGHLICTHSYDHVNLCNLRDEAAVEQVNHANSVLRALTGENPEYIRPPFGCWKKDLDYETQMIEILWDVDPRDWATDNADVVADRVIENVKENDIILLHDASESSIHAAFQIIDVLSKEGYTFVTVDELILD